jgi:hypothetical protein
MWTILWLAAALAAPPSSTLTGPEGTLEWKVESTADGVKLEGRSPKWTVLHEAAADFSPKRTVRTDAIGNEVTVEYSATGAVVKLPTGTVSVDGKGLWDGDAVDVRLGWLVAKGKPENAFQAVDPATGKVYSLDSQLVGNETCGAAPCTHVLVQLTGLLRYVGPSWHYWYAADGKLLRFEGPIGAYEAKSSP